MRQGLLNWLILLILVLIWGSSFILMKIGLLAFSPVELGSLRISLTFLFLLPFALSKINKQNLKKWYLFAISGIIGNGLPAFLFAYAQTGLESSLTGVLNSLTPVFTLLIGLVLFRLKVRWYNIIGIIIGFAGVYALLTSGGNGDFEFNLHFALYVIIATFFYAFNLNFVKKYFSNVSPLDITSYAFAYLGIPAILFLILKTDFLLIMQTSDIALKGFTAVVILSFAGTAGAMILFNYLLQKTNVVFSASVTYMMPVVAVLWGISDGEQFSLISILWIVIILSGVFLVNSNFNPKYLKK